MKESDKRLFQVFDSIRTEQRSKAFESFRVFRAWAYRTGYDDGLALFRTDTDKPFSAENCYWGLPDGGKIQDDPGEPEKVMTEDYSYIIAKWDRFVDGVRQMLNLPPIMTADPCTGCPKARQCELYDTVCKTRMRWWDKRMRDIREQEGWNG